MDINKKVLCQNEEHLGRFSHGAKPPVLKKKIWATFALLVFDHPQSIHVKFESVDIEIKREELLRVGLMFHQLPFGDFKWQQDWLYAIEYMVSFYLWI